MITYFNNVINVYTNIVIALYDLRIDFIQLDFTRIAFLI